MYLPVAACSTCGCRNSGTGSSGRSYDRRRDQSEWRDPVGLPVVLPRVIRARELGLRLLRLFRKENIRGGESGEGYAGVWSKKSE